MIPTDAPTQTVLDRATRGFRATLLSQAVRIACKAGSVVVLARIVSPADHGLFAMASSLVLVLVLFRDLGLGAAAVQAQHLSDEQKTTIWWVHIGTGIALTALALALTPLVAKFYHEPRVTPVLATMSFSLLIICLNNWPRVLLSRDLQFTELIRLETFAVILGTIAMIAAGALGAGAFSFVVFLFVSETGVLIAAWRVCRWRPRGAPHWSGVRELLRCGAELTGYNLCLYLLQQIDILLMGKLFGATAVGLYTRPGQLLYLPNLHVSGPLTQVLMASLSRLGASVDEFVRHVRETSNLIAHLTLPLAAICFVLPDEIVRTLLGAAWPESAPLLRWLAISAATTYLTATTYALCVATMHTRRLAFISAAALVMIVIGLWLGRAHGPVGLAGGLAAANAAFLLPRLWWATLGTPVRLRDFARAFAGPVALSLALAGGLAGGRALVSEASAVARLASALAGGALAAGLLATLWPQLRAELKSVWQHRPRAGAFSPAKSSA